MAPLPTPSHRTWPLYNPPRAQSAAPPPSPLPRRRKTREGELGELAANRVRRTGQRLPRARRSLPRMNPTLARGPTNLISNRLPPPARPHSLSGFDCPRLPRRYERPGCVRWADRDGRLLCQLRRLCTDRATLSTPSVPPPIRIPSHWHAFPAAAPWTTVYALAMAMRTDHHPSRGWGVAAGGRQAAGVH